MQELTSLQERRIAAWEAAADLLFGDEEFEGADLLAAFDLYNEAWRNMMPSRPTAAAS